MLLLSSKLIGFELYSQPVKSSIRDHGPKQGAAQIVEANLLRSVVRLLFAVQKISLGK